MEEEWDCSEGFGYQKGDHLPVGCAASKASLAVFIPYAVIFVGNTL